MRDGALVAPNGQLPFNTDGGGLCNNHPANRGGMTKVIEAVRQLRGEAHPAVQVPDCDDRPGPRHRRHRWQPHGQRHPRSWERRTHDRRTSRCRCREPRPGPDDQPFWDAAAEGRLLLPRCRRVRRLHLVPADVLPRLPHVRGGLGAGHRPRHGLQLHREHTRQGAVGRRTRRTSSPTSSWTKGRG